MTVGYCGHCGLALAGDKQCEQQGNHTSCDLKVTLEPPRFCVKCGRRMKVQVVPRGWTAECVEHDVITG